MGYYTGNGVITSGGSSTNIYEHFVFYGAHNIYQMHTVSTRKKLGVSLSTAQSELAACNMQTHQFTWGGNKYHFSPNCKGSTKGVQYSQIGGSNLYELTITNDQVKARLDEGSWVS